MNGGFARVEEDRTDFQVVPEEMVVGPEVAVAPGRGRALRAGAPDVQFSHAQWIRDGRLVRFRHVVDPRCVAANLA